MYYTAIIPTTRLPMMVTAPTTMFLVDVALTEDAAPDDTVGLGEELVPAAWIIRLVSVLAVVVTPS